MEPLKFSRRFRSLVITSLLLLPSLAIAQRQAITKNETELSPHQQDALDLLKTLARELKSESDKLTAAALQARIADVLWKYDEYFAKEVFSWAFEAARKPPADHRISLGSQ